MIICSDKVFRNLINLRARLKMLFSYKEVLEIQAMRENLKKEVRRLVDEKGALIFENFE